LNYISVTLCRFRSIAKSYFRRADGVLLLYDVTYERSFINVRDWLEAIEVSRSHKFHVFIWLFSFHSSYRVVHKNKAAKFLHFISSSSIRALQPG